MVLIGAINRQPHVQWLKFICDKLLSEQFYEVKTVTVIALLYNITTQPYYHSS